MFVIIWDIYYVLVDKTLILKIVYFICYLMLLYAFGDNSLDAILGIVPPLIAIVTLTFSYQLNKSVTSVERFFLGFYPVVLVDLARRFFGYFLLSADTWHNC